MSTTSYSFDHLDDFETGCEVTKLILTEGDFPALKAMVEKELQTFGRNMTKAAFEQTRIINGPDGKPSAARKEIHTPAMESAARIFGIAITAGQMYFDTKTALTASTAGLAQLTGLVEQMIQLHHDAAKTTTTLEISE